MRRLNEMELKDSLHKFMSLALTNQLTGLGLLMRCYITEDGGNFADLTSKLLFGDTTVTYKFKSKEIYLSDNRGAYDDMLAGLAMCTASANLLADGFWEILPEIKDDVYGFKRSETAVQVIRRDNGDCRWVNKSSCGMFYTLMNEPGLRELFKQNYKSYLFDCQLQDTKTCIELTTNLLYGYKAVNDHIYVLNTKSGNDVVVFGKTSPVVAYYGNVLRDEFVNNVKYCLVQEERSRNGSEVLQSADA